MDEQRSKDIADLGSWLHSPGWQRIGKGAIADAIGDLQRVLIYGGAKDLNGAPISDEQLKARIKNLYWMLDWENKFAGWLDEMAQERKMLEAPPEDEPAGTILHPDAQFGM